MLAINPSIVSLKTNNSIAPNAPTPDNIPQGDKFNTMHMVSMALIIIIINFSGCK